MGQSILFVCLDVTNLSTIGTLSCRSGGDLLSSVDLGGPGIPGAGFVMQLLLLFSGLSSCLVLFQSFELLLNSS